jgi:hypothetical protein
MFIRQSLLGATHVFFQSPAQNPGICHILLIGIILSNP